jgi:transcriptional regulator with XRE-family HTH domain
MTARERLKHFREKKGMTQMALAQALGTHPTMLSDFEHGRRVPNLKMAAKIEKVTKIPVAAWVA